MDSKYSSVNMLQHALEVVEGNLEEGSPEAKQVMTIVDAAMIAMINRTLLDLIVDASQELLSREKAKEEID